jgi:hypothetical protein
MNYARVIDGEIVEVIVAEQEWISSQSEKLEYIRTSDIKGFCGIGSKINLEDGYFYPPRPHDLWVRDGQGSWRPPLEKPNPWQHLTIAGHFGVGKDVIYSIENILQSESVDQIASFAKSLDLWPVKTGNNSHVLNEDTIKSSNNKIYEELLKASDSVLKVVEKKFNVSVHQPYVSIARMGPGASQDEHYDKMSDYYEYSEMPARDKDLTAVIYWNNDFTGGVLNFPQHKLSISPKPGLVVTYPGDKYHTHSVSKVKGGYRYTTPLFFSIKEIK